MVVRKTMMANKVLLFDFEHHCGDTEDPGPRMGFPFSIIAMSQWNIFVGCEFRFDGNLLLCQ